MPRINPLIDSFAYGEITPKLWGRLNTNPHKQGIASCYNMIPDARGAVLTRPGSRFLTTLPTDKGRLFAVSSYDEFYFIVFTQQQMHVINLYGSIIATKSTPYYYSSLARLFIIGVPGTNDIWVFHSDYTPRQFTLGTWDLSEISFTGAPTYWNAGNYPGYCEFYQGRSWFANHPHNPESFSSSKSGNFTDLTEGSEDDAGLRFTINRSKNFLIGTDNSEFIITSVGPIITPGDVNAEPQSSHGSSYVPPQSVGNEEVFVSADQRHLRSMSYRWTESGWFAIDLAFAADHLVKRRIEKLAFARNPDPVLWLINEDNELIGCSYLRMDSESKDIVVGWHKHPFGLPYIDVAVADYNGVSQVGLLQKKDDGLQLSVLTFHESNYFLDRQLKFVLNDATVITGLDHLEGEVVGIVADGNIHPDRTVSSGQVTLDYPASNVTVGIKYLHGIKTLPLAFFSNQYGAVVSQMKRWNKIYVRVYDSIRPVINGIQPPSRDVETHYSVPQPTQTEDVFTVNLGYDINAQIIVESDIPRNLQILSIAGEANFEQV